MPKRNLCVLVLLFLACPVLCSLARAGTLDDFEEEATVESSPRGHGDNHRRSEDYDDDSGFFTDFVSEVVLGLAEITVVEGGSQSWQRVRPPAFGAAESVDHREEGEPAIPFVRLDLGYHEVESDIRDYDGRLELGYGPLALQIRDSHFEEDQPDDSLDLIQIHGLFRMTFTRYFEMDLGLGTMMLKGNETHSGASLTVPMQIFFSRRWGVSFRPSWGFLNGQPIRDYDLGLHLTRGILSLRTGYRWLVSGGTSLNGPFAGLSLHY